ncbi:MAG TPA: hypothetical protein VGD99_15260 [Anaerolineae bacterium]
MNRVRKRVWVLIILLSLAIALIGITAVAAGGAQVTNGGFQTFAAGLESGYDISGRAQMVRTADGRTLTQVQAWGLATRTTYPVHVHNAPCGVNNAGGHYQDVVGGPVDDVNEIWPGFTTNANGHGNGYAANDFIARPEAQSVVIHDVDGARIACADLQ